MANQACVSGSFPGPTENLLVLWLKSQTDTQHYIRHRRSIVLGRFLLSFLIFAVCVVSQVADDGTLLVRCNCAAEMIGTWEDWAGLRDRDRARCLRVGVVGTVISWKTETIVLITLIIMGIWLISKILSAIINPFYYEPLHYLFFFYVYDSVLLNILNKFWCQIISFTTSLFPPFEHALKFILVASVILLKEKDGKYNSNSSSIVPLVLKAAITSLFEHLSALMGWNNAKKILVMFSCLCTGLFAFILLYVWKTEISTEINFK